MKELDVSAMVKHDDIVWGRNLDERPQIAVTLYDENRKELGHFSVGPFHGTSDWVSKSKVIAIPKTAREGILRIGLFGCKGSISFDNVSMKKHEAKK